MLQTLVGGLLPQSRAVSGQHCAHRAQTSRAGPGLGRHRGAGGVEVNKLLGRVKTDAEGAGTRRAGRSSASCTSRKSRARGRTPSVPARGASLPAAHAEAEGTPPAPSPSTDAKARPAQQAEKTPTEDSATPPAKPRAGHLLQPTLSPQQGWKVKMIGHLRKTNSKERDKIKNRNIRNSQVAWLLFCMDY